MSDEAEYVRICDLTRLRIVRSIIFDVMEKSLPQRTWMLTVLGDRIEEIEEGSDQ